MLSTVRTRKHLDKEGMSNPLHSYGKLKRLGAFKASLRLLRDPNASRARKTAIIGATLIGIIYAVFPDPTDIIPVLGLLDEGLVLFVVRSVLVWLAGQYR